MQNIRFKTVVDLPRSGRSSKFTPRPDCVMHRETATSQTPQASVNMLNVKVHDSKIGKRVNKYGLFEGVAGESFFSLKRMWQQLRFAKLLLEQGPLDKPDQRGDLWS